MNFSKVIRWIKDIINDLSPVRQNVEVVSLTSMSTDYYQPHHFPSLNTVDCIDTWNGSPTCTVQPITFSHLFKEKNGGNLKDNRTKFKRNNLVKTNLYHTTNCKQNRNLYRKNRLQYPFTRG